MIFAIPVFASVQLYVTDVFDDVKDGDFAADEIAYFYNNGIIKGYPDGKFWPERKIERAEAAAIISRIGDNALGDLDAVDYTDVPSDSWFANYVLNATTNGYLVPTNDDKLFDPYGTVDRLGGGLIAGGITGSGDESGDTTLTDTVALPFTDLGDLQLTDEQISLLTNLYQLGVLQMFIEGSSDPKAPTYQPTLDLTRAQFVMLLSKATLPPSTPSGVPD